MHMTCMSACELLAISCHCYLANTGLVLLLFQMSSQFYQLLCVQTLLNFLSPDFPTFPLFSIQGIFNSLVLWFSVEWTEPLYFIVGSINYQQAMCVYCCVTITLTCQAYVNFWQEQVPLCKFNKYTCSVSHQISSASNFVQPKSATHHLS